VTDRDLAETAVADSGLIGPGTRGVALLSGGPDSVALLAGLAGLLGPESVVALHVNYGLRSDSDRDEETCREVCRRLGVSLESIRSGERQGNLHDWARTVRYGEAERIAERDGLDWIAVGHTRSDLVETVLYRLASSPGTRALRAMPARRGRVVRPLLGLERDEARAAAVAAGLPFVDDPSNLDPAFARARIRSRAMPALRQVNPGFERNVVRTLAELEQEAAFLDSMASLLLEDGPDRRPLITTETIVSADPAVARHALRLLIERAAGRAVPVSIDSTELVRTLATRPEGGSVDLGSGLMLEVGSGVVLAEGGRDAAPEPVRLTIPGALGWAGWLFGAGSADSGEPEAGPATATLDREVLDEVLEIRRWQPGDRIRPLGMEGTRKVADLMAERRLPRPRRIEWPVVEASGQIVWVPGVAVSEEFRANRGTRDPILLTAEPPGAAADGSDT
jgi:tRNA(Ile)-lysidine synthase